MRVVVVRMSFTANLLLGVSQSIAASRGKAMQVTIDGDILHFDYVSPTDRDGQLWEDHYRNAAIYYEGFCQPINITKTDAEQLDMKTTDYLSHYMNQDILQVATSTQWEDFDLHAKLLVGVIVSILLMTVVVVGVMA